MITDNINHVFNCDGKPVFIGDLRQSRDLRDGIFTNDLSMPKARMKYKSRNDITKRADPSTLTVVPRDMLKT